MVGVLESCAVNNARLRSSSRAVLCRTRHAHKATPQRAIVLSAPRIFHRVRALLAVEKGGSQWRTQNKCSGAGARRRPGQRGFRAAEWAAGAAGHWGWGCVSLRMRTPLSGLEGPSRLRVSPCGPLVTTLYLSLSLSSLSSLSLSQGRGLSFDFVYPPRFNHKTLLGASWALTVKDNNCLSLIFYRRRPWPASPERPASSPSAPSCRGA